VRRLLGWNELSAAHELSFDVALHFGTLLSVLFYFRRTWFQIIRAALGEKVGKLEKPLTRISLVDSLMIGIAQAFALIPGVSRSGSTITAGLFRGLTREAAVRFSFLLSTPLIAGAALLKARELHKEGLPLGMQMPVLVGIIISALVGYAAIAWLIRYLQSNSLRLFIVYRIVAGIVVIALAYFMHLQ